MKNRVYGAIGVIGCGLLSACGGGGSGGGSAGPTPVNPPASTYPSVAGTYAFIPGKATFTCSDGSRGTSSIGAQNVAINQMGNQLKLVSTNQSPPGITVIDSTGIDGLLEKNREFSLQQISQMAVDGLGTLLVTRSINGRFSNSGWSGDYEFGFVSYDMHVSCDYKTVFSGDKIIASQSLEYASDSKTQDIDLRIILFNLHEGAGEVLGTID